MKKTVEEIQAKLDQFNKKYKENGLTDGKISRMASYDAAKNVEFLKRSFLSPEAKVKAATSQIKLYGYVGGNLHNVENKTKALNSRIEKYGSKNGNMITPEANAKKIKKYGSIVGHMQTPEVRTKVEKPILQFDKHNNFIKEWPSAKNVENVLGINAADICNCCKERQKTTKGFIWKYKN